jgi:hypothetical protein
MPDVMGRSSALSAWLPRRGAMMNWRLPWATMRPAGGVAPGDFVLSSVIGFT